MRRLGQALVIAAALGGAPGLAAAEPPNTHEIIYNRPSGFWTSNRPAEGGAYRWRLLAIGGGVLAITALLVVVTIRNASTERKLRGTPASSLRSPPR